MSKQIISQYMEKFEHSIFNAFNSLSFNDLTNNLNAFKGALLDAGLSLVSGVLTDLDEKIVKSVERKSSGWIVHKRQVTRMVETSLGNLTFERTYFRRQESGEYIYLLDHLIGIESYERISKELMADIIGLCNNMSFAQAVKVSDADISRQTVSNRILALDEIVPDIKPEHIECDRINIYVDEDHITVREKGKKKRTAIVPVAVASSGIDDSVPGRNKLKNPLYLAEYGASPEAFFDNLYGMMSRKYNLDSDPEIIIHADGGRWIKQADMAFPEALYAMDGFHLRKYEKKLLSYFDKETGEKVKAALDGCDWEELGNLYRNLIKNTTDTDTRKQIRDAYKYFKNNEKAITVRKKEDVSGSCTEAMVSHLTAERTTRIPGAWSIEGLKKIVMIRMTYANGGKIDKTDIRKSLEKYESDEEKRAREKERNDVRERTGYKKYQKYLEEEQAQIAKAVRERWSGNRSSFYFDTTSGTQILLKIISQLPTTT